MDAHHLRQGAAMLLIMMYFNLTLRWLTGGDQLAVYQAQSQRTI